MGNFFAKRALTILICSSCFGNVSAATVKVWHPIDEPRLTYFSDAFFRGFERLNPDMRVEETRIGGSLYAVHQKLYSSDDLPDVALVDKESIVTLADQGLIAPLDLIANSVALLPEVASSVTYQGKVWGLPLESSEESVAEISQARFVNRMPDFHCCSRHVPETRRTDQDGKCAFCEEVSHIPLRSIRHPSK
ncbi:hypothetical protein ACFL1X_14780 [Candidatus Hydrogenedentota bacterium]